jgi:hypothetical protein
MKKLFLSAILPGLLPLFLNAQQLPDPGKDSAMIIATVLDYAEGYYSGDAVRMERAILPDLNKVLPNRVSQTGKIMLIYSTYSGLIEGTRAKFGMLEEPKRKISVKVLQINDDVASAMLTSAIFNDYLSLVRFEGKWKIINVLWTWGPDSPNRPQGETFNAGEEKKAIEKTLNNLVEGMQAGDTVRVKKAIHPEFKRATVVSLPQTGKSFISREGSSMIIEASRSKTIIVQKEKTPVKVNILAIADGLAFVELVIPTGWNYCQMARIGGQWKLINMLRKVNPAAQQKK